ncbi:hypothetical protein GCM10010394_04930 [Streptomyces crystallinus]|uniref:Uncharacterized protein n=1 Tax=Streptomyces crystallinus TaxID=68191 RepID=A0ABP3Q5N2_9ACTN
MAESSWPFGTGDGQRVDPTRWQSLTTAGSPSGVVGRWGDAALSVSVSPSQAGAVDVAPGRAFVRGFIYQTDQPVTLPLNTQTEPNPRIDLVVVELDVPNSSASLRILKGQPAAVPVAPGVRQIDGGIWQYPLAQVTVRRGQTAVDTIRDVRTLLDSGRPPAVAATNVPTNPTPGDLAYYKSQDSGAEELHMYAARGGWSIAASLGKAMSYTPQLSYAAGSYSAKGQYQWLSSNSMAVSINVRNTSGKTWKTDALNVTLPTKSRGGMWQVLTCALMNNEHADGNGGMPNYTIGSAYTYGGSTCQPVFQTTGSPINGGDWWGTFPVDSTLIVTGVYVADYFREGNV